MFLCVNMELKMDKGKMCAQCGHATLGAYKTALKYCPTAVTWWQRTGQAKIAVKVEKESLIYEIQKKAKEAGLVTYLVLDAGRTQIAAGSRTVLAIGPAPTKSFEGITNNLKLL